MPNIQFPRAMLVDMATMVAALATSLTVLYGWPQVAGCGARACRSRRPR